jgi:hypothetical protein
MRSAREPFSPILILLLIMLLIMIGPAPAEFAFAQQEGSASSVASHGAKGTRHFSDHPEPDGAKTEELNRLTTAVGGSLPSASTRPIAINNYLDEFIFRKIQRDRIPHAELCSDVEFLRRVSLDLTGRLPEPEKIREFVKDADPKKREKLVDALMVTSTKGATVKPATPFLDRWNYFFSDLFSVGNLNGPGRTLVHRYLDNFLITNQPYDEFVRQILTVTTRSTHASAEGNFLERYYVDQPDQTTVNHEDTYDEWAIRTGRIFLGINLECISCHDGKNHLDKINLWLTEHKRADLWRQAAFFSKVKLYRPYGDLVDEFVLSNEGKGYYDTSSHSVVRIQRYKADVTPTFILTGEHPEPGEDPRAAFARMLTSNIQFARATVNLFWSELFGVGIVDPPTGFDLTRYDTRAAQTPAPWGAQTIQADLLDAMAKDFQAHHFDLRYLIRLIATSSAYQLSNRVEGSWKSEYHQYFARRLVHRLPAEQIWDAISQATGVFEEFNAGDSATKVKYAQQTVSPEDLPGNLTKILVSFGLDDRVLKPRSLDLSTLQSSVLLNSGLVKAKLKADTKGSRLEALLNAEPPKANKDIVEELFLATLARFPSPAEEEFGEKLLAEHHAKGGEDLLWALINKPEFILNY